MTNRSDGPTPAALYRQARGNPDEYRRLIHEHGMLVDGPAQPLPCGWTPEGRGVPVPSIDPLPGAVDVQARAIHARYLRDNLPGITDAEILRDWSQINNEGRAWLHAEANRLIWARADRPAGEPDDVDAIARRLTGMGADDLRQQHPGPAIWPRAGYQCAAGGDACPGHPSQWLMCGMDEEPEHRAARRRTEAEQAAIEAVTWWKN